MLSNPALSQGSSAHQDEQPYCRSHGAGGCKAQSDCREKKEASFIPLDLAVVPKSNIRCMSASTSSVSYRALCTPNTGAVLQPGPRAEHNPCTAQQQLCRAELILPSSLLKLQMHTHDKHQRETRQRLSTVLVPTCPAGREGLFGGGRQDPHTTTHSISHKMDVMFPFHLNQRVAGSEPRGRGCKYPLTRAGCRHSSTMEMSFPARREHP